MKIGFASMNTALFCYIQEEMNNEDTKLIQLPKHSDIFRHINSLNTIFIDIPCYNEEDFKWCSEVASVKNMMVIVMSQDYGEFFKEMALKNGAKNVLVYPGHTLINNLLQENRISKENHMTRESPGMFLGDGLHLDLLSRCFIDHGEEQSLSPTEFRLLHILASQLDRMISIDEILERVWGEAYLDKSQVYVYVRRLRCKIEKDPKNPKRLIGRRGVGYAFTAKY